MLLCALGLYPAKQEEPRAEIILLYFVRTFSWASAKTCYAPATAQATIVQPAFVRSLSADGKEKEKIKTHVIARRNDEAIS